MRWGWLLLLAGCQLGPVIPTEDAGFPGDGGAGTGSLQGPLAFPVHGAFELHNTPGGQLTGFSFVLVEHDLSCSQLEALDGGAVAQPFRQIYAGVLANQANDGPPPSTYQVLTNFPPGGGYAAFVSYSDIYGDGGQSGPFTATDGSVTFATSGPYEVSGSFNATVPDANGQSTNLSGTFDAPYCP